jgi:hypothetical protein
VFVPVAACTKSVSKVDIIQAPLAKLY